MPHCPNCGAEIEEDYLFCPDCGQALRAVPREPVSFAHLVGRGLRCLLAPVRPPPPLYRPTDVVYERRPPYSPVRRYLLLGFILGVVGMFLMYGGEWLTYFGVTIIGMAPPILYFLWMRRNDRYEEEPLGMVLFTIGWGIFIGIFAGILNSFLAESLHLGAYIAAFTEEPLKALGVYLLARHKTLGREFNDHMDGLVYGSGAGAGFALMENFQYIYQNAVMGTTPLPSIAGIRAVSALGHLVYTGLTGLILGYAKAKRGYLMPTDFIAALIPGMILHALWNTLPSLFFILAPLYAFIYYKNIRAAQRDEELWGYRIRAPVE